LADLGGIAAVFADRQNHQHLVVVDLYAGIRIELRQYFGPMGQREPKHRQAKQVSKIAKHGVKKEFLKIQFYRNKQ